MKVLVAVNEFKGSLSSLEIGEIISDKLNSNYDNITTLIQPIADGGDGFFEHYLKIWENEILKLLMQHVKNAK